MIALATSTVVVISIVIIVMIIFTYHYLDQSQGVVSPYLLILVEAVGTIFYVNYYLYECASDYSEMAKPAVINVFIIVATMILTFLFFGIAPFATISLNDKRKSINAFITTLQWLTFIIFIFIAMPYLINNNADHDFNNIYIRLDDEMLANINDIVMTDPNTILDWLTTGACSVLFVIGLLGRIFYVYYGGFGLVSSGLEIIRGTIFNSNSPYIRNEKRMLHGLLEALEQTRTDFEDYTNKKIEVLKKRSNKVHAPRPIQHTVVMIVRIVSGCTVIILSIIYATCIICSLYGSIAYSDCGWSCGYIPQYTGIAFPLEYFMSFLMNKKLFIIRYLIIGTLFMYSSITVFLGARKLKTYFISTKSFTLKHKQTMPGSLVLIVTFICFASIGFTFQLSTVFPNIFMYGSQLDSNNKQCTISSPHGDCSPTTIAIEYFKIISYIPFLQLFVYFLNIILIFALSKRMFTEIFLSIDTLFIKKEQPLLKGN
ncbi:LMBR1 family region protein [Entamoeba marina]